MRRIVVGVDGSPAAGRALEWALREASRGGGELTVAHAWDLTALPAFAMSTAVASGVAAAAEELADQSLAKALAAVPAAVSVPVTRVVVEERPARALVRLAADAAMLVVGARGASGLSATFLGSVSSACVHHCVAPVVVVPDAPTDVAAAGRVVVGVDGSPASLSALRWAAAQAESRDWPLVTVYAWRLPFVPTPVGYAPYVPPLDAFEGSARQVLADIVETAALAIEPQQQVVRGAAAASLLDVAAPTDLLVVGSRGRGGFRGLLLGSVSSQCVNHACCPTAVVRAHEERLG